MFKSAKIAAAAGVMLGMMLAGTAALAAGGGGIPSIVTKCTLGDWECTPWACNVSDFERTCTAKINCTDVDNTRPPEKTSFVDDCQFETAPKNAALPACHGEEDWICGPWQCTWNNSHEPLYAVRNCVHSDDCILVSEMDVDTTNMSCKNTVPQESQPVSIVCTENDWQCTAWEKPCKWLDGDDFASYRSCSRIRNCIDYNDTEPTTIQHLTQSCDTVDDKYSPGYVAPSPQPQPQQPSNVPAQQANPNYGNAWPDTSSLMKQSAKISTADFTPASTIDADKNLAVSNAGLCTPNTLIKASLPAVYYCGSNSKRFVFPNEKTYFSWYGSFDKVVTITDAAMSQIPIGGNVTYRPGMRMVKIMSSPTVYAVAQGGVLRPIASEAVAQELYGSDWNTKIDDISDAFFVNYTVGATLDF